MDHHLTSIMSSCDGFTHAALSLNLGFKMVYKCFSCLVCLSRPTHEGRPPCARSILSSSSSAWMEMQQPRGYVHIIRTVPLFSRGWFHLLDASEATSSCPLPSLRSIFSKGTGLVGLLEKGPTSDGTGKEVNFGRVYDSPSRNASGRVRRSRGRPTGAHVDRRRAQATTYVRRERTVESDGMLSKAVRRADGTSSVNSEHLRGWRKGRSCHGMPDVYEAVFSAPRLSFQRAYAYPSFLEA